MTDTDKPQGTHFWSVSFAKGGDSTFFNGTCTPPPGATRLDMFNDIVDTIIKEYPRVSGAAVLAFDIQPNQL